MRVSIERGRPSAKTSGLNVVAMGSPVRLFSLACNNKEQQIPAWTPHA